MDHFIVIFVFGSAVNLRKKKKKIPVLLFILQILCLNTLIKHVNRLYKMDWMEIFICWC